MKKLFLMALPMTLMIGCSSGISQEAYEAAVSEASQAQQAYESAAAEAVQARSEIESVAADARGQVESAAAQVIKLQEEFDSYKESMKPFEEFSAIEAEAMKLEAESRAVEASLAMESSKAEEESLEAARQESIEASIAAEEAKGYETGITYNQLARTPDEFEGQKVKFTGKVIQVIDGDSSRVQIRLAVNKDYDKILYCTYSKSIVSSRILEDDIITVYGVSDGLLSYQSTMGGTITIPSAKLDKIDQ